MTKILLGYDHFSVPSAYVRDAANYFLNPSTEIPASVKAVQHLSVGFTSARQRVMERYSPDVTCRLSLQGRILAIPNLCVALESAEEATERLAEATHLYIATSRVPERILPGSEYTLAARVLQEFDRRLEGYFGKWFGWEVVSLAPDFNPGPED